MRQWVRPVLALIWKDILVELRSKEVITSVLVFGLLALVVFNFAFDPNPQTVERLAPGILWVAFAFAGILGLNRSFSLEKEQGGMEGLMLCPVGREVIYWGKMLAIFLFLLLVEAVLLPLFSILFNLPLLLPRLLLVTLLATLGFVAIGTLLSAVAVNTRSRETMLPLLFLPLVVPVFIAAVVTTGTVLRGGPWSQLSPWLQLILVFDVVFLTLSSLVFESVLQE